MCVGCWCSSIAGCASQIDLGVAFDLGKVLKTPEIVPFRLTRGFSFTFRARVLRLLTTVVFCVTSDIVDPMGVTGVEGVFRRCCEETMRVLRANEEMLLTVLQVFVHDPLYKWALSPQQIDRLRPTEASAGSASSAASAQALEKSDVNEPVAGASNVGAQRAMMAVTAKVLAFRCVLQSVR
jgi:phosphatidylinositol kinase/protein kinase (PI-3  family)